MKIFIYNTIDIKTTKGLKMIRFVNGRFMIKRMKERVLWFGYSIKFFVF